jgi:hypothetical protein
MYGEEFDEDGEEGKIYAMGPIKHAEGQACLTSATTMKPTWMTWTIWTTWMKKSKYEREMPWLTLQS